MKNLIPKEKLKFLTVGDMHFMNSNMKEIDLEIDIIFENIKIYNPDFIVILGDTLHNNNNYDGVQHNRATNFLSKLCDVIKTFVLIGNHDIKSNDEFLPDVNPFNTLKKWNNIKIIDKPYKETINGHEICFIPYVPKGSFFKALNMIEDWKNSSCIFAHQEFNGCIMGGISSTSSDVWFKEYPLCISGHIHDYCEVGNNLIFVGTFLQHTFDESENKSLSIFEFDENIKWKQTRIFSNLQKKVEHFVTINTIKNYDINYNHLNKIYLIGTLEEVESMWNHANAKKWRASKAKVVKKSIVKETDQIDNIKEKKISYEIQNINFMKSFYSKISKNINVLNYFEKKFGKVLVT